MSTDSGNTDGILSLKKIFESNDSFIDNFYSSFKSLSEEKLFDSISGSSGRNFVEKGIDKIYEKKSDKLITDLKQSLGKLNDLRSNYVPWDIAKVITAETNELLGEAKASGRTIGITSNKFIKESYENCFMRAMGMPHSDDILKAISLGGSFSYLSLASEKPKEVSTKNSAIFENILLQRELVNTRVAKVTSTFFSFEDNTRSLDSYVYQNKRDDFNKIVERYINSIDVSSQDGLYYHRASGQAKTEEELFQAFFSEVSDFNISEQSARNFFRKEILRIKIKDPSVFNLHEELKKIKYLLVPPVQNSSISQCVSESSKIVKRPFEYINERTVNNETPKISFLETVIRIRLDKVTGLSYTNVVGVLKKITNSNSPGDRTEELTLNDFSDFSLIENIIINRLRKAIAAGVKNLEKDIINYMISAGESMSQPSENNKGKTGEDSETGSKVKVNVSEGLFGQNLSKLNYISSLKDLRSIDESILFLLSDKEKISALELISDGLRSSSLRDGLFLDDVVSAISIVKKYLDEELERVQDFLKQNERNTSGLNESVEKIAEKVGIYKGVGYLDILAFALAMFTVGEEVLIGTLNSDQYNNLKKEINNIVFFKEIDEKNIGLSRNAIQLNSLNALTKRLIEIYSLMEELLITQ